MLLNGILYNNFSLNEILNILISYVVFSMGSIINIQSKTFLSFLHAREEFLKSIYTIILILIIDINV